MDYDLPPETEEFRRVVRSFAEEVVRPVAGYYDARSEFPLDVVRQMGKLGLFGLVLPERYGGADAEVITLCVAIEELARGAPSAAIPLVAGVGLGAMPFALFGTEEQKQTWLPPMAAGEVLGAFGLTEAGGGSDVEAPRNVSTTDGDGGVTRRCGPWPPVTATSG